jgi:hypothetical protein
MYFFSGCNWESKLVPILKYNFIGTAARLWSPRGPNFGTVSVILDEKLQINLTLFAADWES